MPNTTYKGYSVPTTGTLEDTWGDEINTNSFGVIDKNVGGIAAKTLSNSNVTLSASESQMLILRLNGTISANCQVTTSCQGMTIVENLTSGAFNVTFTNGVGTPITLAQGARTIVITDSTNGPRAAAGTDPAVPTGSSMLFFNASAPAGWTISATHNNKAIRLVSSNGGATGGSTSFTSVFTSRTIAQANLPNVNLTAESNGNHTHTISRTTLQMRGDGSAVNPFAPSGQGFDLSATSTGVQTTGAHTHNVPLGGSGTALDFAVSYVDAIICLKD